MKKMVALACAGLMVASVVTGCGSKKDDADKSGGEKRVLKFDSFSGGNGEEVWKDLEAAFEKKYPEVDVQMRFEKDLPAVLNKENATGTYSDLVYYNVGQKSGFTESQLNSGEVMDISDVFANAKDGFTNNQQAVIDGKALFMPNGYWVKNEMSKTTPEKGFKWGVMALPAFEKDGKRAIASFTEQAWIPKQAKNSADAKKFLEFIYSEEGAEIMLKHDIVAPVKGITDKIDKNSDLGKAFATYSEKNVETIVGASYAAYDKKALPKLDFNASLYGPIDDIATGKKDVATWKSELIKLWKELKANPVK